MLWLSLVVVITNCKFFVTLCLTFFFLCYALADFFSFHSMDAVNIDNVKIRFMSLGNSLKPTGRVEKYVINALCRKLFKDSHPVNSKKHYFFSTIGVSNFACFFS